MEGVLIMSLDELLKAKREDILLKEQSRPD
jgi:hypothetical protein